MGLEQQLMIRVNTTSAEATTSQNVLANRIDELESELARIKLQIEQIKGMRSAFKQVNDYYNELMSQPDEIRKYDGVK